MLTYLKSAKTTVIGVLIVICGGVVFTGVLEAYNNLLMLFCAAMTGAGFIASKDANVTNAVTAAAPTVVPKVLADKPNPIAQVK